MTVRHEGRSLEARTLNLSLGGACVSLEGRLPLGATVALSFKIPSHDQAIEVSGEVRWSTDQDTGLQFGGLRAREVWELTRYFESL